MDPRIEELIKELELKPGAESSAVMRLALDENFRLPKDLIDFLLFSDGAEGSVGKSYLALWSVEQIRTLNEAYAMNEIASGLVIFGSDGGAMAYAYNKEVNLIVEVPFIDLDISQKEAKPVAQTLSGFLEYLYQRN